MDGGNLILPDKDTGAEFWGQFPPDDPLIDPYPAPDWEQIKALVERLVTIAAGHEGEFLISGLGEDPQTGEKLPSIHLHPKNDHNACGNILRAIEMIVAKAHHRKSSVAHQRIKILLRRVSALSEIPYHPISNCAAVALFSVELLVNRFFQQWTIIGFEGLVPIEFSVTSRKGRARFFRCHSHGCHSTGPQNCAHACVQRAPARVRHHSGYCAAAHPRQVGSTETAGQGHDVGDRKQPHGQGRHDAAAHRQDDGSYFRLSRRQGELRSCPLRPHLLTRCSSGATMTRSAEVARHKSACPQTA